MPILVLRNLEEEANKFYDRAYKSYNADLLTICYVKHFLSPYIDSEANHNATLSKFHSLRKVLLLVIRIVYLKINRGFLPFPNYFNNTETPIFAIDITNLLSTLFDFSKIITDMDKDSNTSNS